MANGTLARPAMGTATPKPVRGSARLKTYENKLTRKRATEKGLKAAKQDEAAHDRLVRFHCFLRDKKRCRALGVLLEFDTDNLKKRAENHHVVPLSLGGSNEPSNRCTLSPEAHRMRHDSELEITGNADECLHMKQYEFKGGLRLFVREWESCV